MEKINQKSYLDLWKGEKNEFKKQGTTGTDPWFVIGANYYFRPKYQGWIGRRVLYAL